MQKCLILKCFLIIFGAACFWCPIAPGVISEPKNGIKQDVLRLLLRRDLFYA